MLDWRDRVRNCVLVAVMCLVSLGQGEDAISGGIPSAAASTNGVAVGRWTTDFPAALLAARRTNRPMLVVVRATNCAMCKRFQVVCEGSAFRKWAEGSGLYLVEADQAELATSSAQVQAAKFVNGLPWRTVKQSPFVGVYWPKSTNEEVRLAFAGRRNMMPGARSRLLAGEFVSAVETVLADYFKALGARPSFEELAKGLTRRIQIACEGPGEVKMTPKSGDLQDERAHVKLSATGLPGATFVGWRAPDGEMLEGKKPVRAKKNAAYTLRVVYEMPEGTYTAVFK